MAAQTVPMTSFRSSPSSARSPTARIAPKVTRTKRMPPCTLVSPHCGTRNFKVRSCGQATSARKHCQVEQLKVKHAAETCTYRALALRGICQVQEQVHGLESDANHVDTDDKGAIGNDAAVEHPHQDAEQANDIRQSLEVLRRLVLENAPERWSAFMIRCQEFSGMAFFSCQCTAWQLHEGLDTAWLKGSTAAGSEQYFAKHPLPWGN